MGFTYHWQIRVDVPKNRLAGAHYDMARLVNALEAEYHLAGGDGTGRPLERRKSGLNSFD